jgi:L-seryl-tRNA(Ser) seleniumtransferase
MLAAGPEELRARAAALVATLTAAGLDAVAVSSTARVGGGGAPEFPLPSAAVSLPAAFAEPLRLGSRPVVGRVEGERTVLDLRSVLPRDDEALGAAVLEVARRWT